jgi:nucleoside-diphosphate-sugar epimerase
VFIGRAVCDRAVNLDATVHGVSRSRPDRPVPGVQYETVDITAADDVLSALRRIRPDVILHLASDVRGTRTVDAVVPMLHTNLVGAVNLMLAAHRSTRPRIVLAGSMEEPVDADAVPQSPYAAAKWAVRGYARMFTALYGLHVIHLRVHMVYGPGQRDTTKLVPYVCQSVLSGVRPRLTSGAREVDWVFIDDVVDAFVMAATADDVDGRTLDVGSGRLTSVRAFVEGLVSALGADVRPEFGAVPDRPLERVHVADIETTKSALGWTPRVELREGLDRTVDFYRSRP